MISKLTNELDREFTEYNVEQDGGIVWMEESNPDTDEVIQVKVCASTIDMAGDGWTEMTTKDVDACIGALRNHL